MFTPKDNLQITNRGSHIEDVELQIEKFKRGFPYMQLVKPALIDNGIIQLDDAAIKSSEDVFARAVDQGLDLVKFVPASGAASRMFQKLFTFRDAAKTNAQAKLLIEEPEHADVNLFFNRLEDFAFFAALSEGLDGIVNPEGEVKYLEVLDFLLSEKGLNYGFLPKGLLCFHRYDAGIRTPVEEHLEEGARYCTTNKGVVKLHFTVSAEHHALFEAKSAAAAKIVGAQHGVTYSISFSEQKPTTDTIAVDPENKPFRKTDGTLLFRPGGHGALLENLNDIDGDVIFVKNIDNVVPDRLKETTVHYKKALAGLLLSYREKIFGYLEALSQPADKIKDALLDEVSSFLLNELCVEPTDDLQRAEKKALVAYLFDKLNRPIRVCGMVKNEGEPGGGPFWAQNSDQTISLQIVEGSQIDPVADDQQKILAGSTHFNPVDLICGVRNYKGEKFDLLKFRDPDTGFISSKSKDGKPLKAQELPGLWNGAMADWNTLFIEVPVSTFNPVKTVNDLLRAEHQSKGSGMCIE